MKGLLIATHNPAKVTEIKLGLKPLTRLGIKLVTIYDLKITKKPEETGKTFEENAMLKAKFYSDISKIPTIADDGGVAINELNGEPGIKSRMWLGHEATDEELMDHTLEKLKGKPLNKRRAYLETCLCFYDPQTNKAVYETENVIGHISNVPSLKRISGFPYRALFIVDEFNKYYDELSDEERQQVNHRLKALKRLTKKIKNLIL